MDINKKAAQAASAGTAKSEQTNPNTKPEGRYVKVYTSIWLDRRFRELSPDGKLAFLHLLTCPGMTALGAMKASVAGLADEVGIGQDGFHEVFHKGFQEGGQASSGKCVDASLCLAIYDPEARCVYLPNYLKFQTPQSPNVVTSWVKALDFIPECGLKTLAVQRAWHFAKGFGKAFEETFRKALPESILEGIPEPYSLKHIAESYLNPPSQDQEGLLRREVHGGEAAPKTCSVATVMEGGVA